MRIALVVALVPLLGWSQDEKPTDVEGSHDHPAVKRWPNSIINEKTYREFESFQFAVKDGTFKTVEGKYLWNLYQLAAGVSCTQVIRNYENALKAQGLAVHSGTEAPNDSIGWGNGKWVSGEGKGNASGALFVVLGCPDDLAEGPLLHLWVVEKQQLEQKVEVDADAMAEEISKNGHIALYGITFASGKAEVTADSEKTLDQISAMLKNKPDWKLRIEGHTDNIGAAKANLELSRKRAEAVKAWLTAKLKIAPARLSTDGFGDKKPLGPNVSDEARAKNRRVELYKL